MTTGPYFLEGFLQQYHESSHLIVLTGLQEWDRVHRQSTEQFMRESPGFLVNMCDIG